MMVVGGRREREWGGYGFSFALPPNSYVEALTPSALEYDGIWRQILAGELGGITRGDPDATPGAGHPQMGDQVGSREMQPFIPQSERPQEQATLPTPWASTSGLQPGRRRFLPPPTPTVCGIW